MTTKKQVKKKKTKKFLSKDILFFIIFIIATAILGLIFLGPTFTAIMIFGILGILLLSSLINKIKKGKKIVSFIIILFLSLFYLSMKEGLIFYFLY